MRVALVPLKTLPKSPNVNFRRLQARLSEIADYQPDLIVLSECTLTGYIYEQEDLDRFAEAIPGPTVARMAQLARDYRTYLCFGLVERAEDGMYDSAVLLNRRGDILLVQRKLSEKPPYRAGTRVESVETEMGNMAVLICGDLFHAEAVAQLPDDLDWLLAPMARAFAGRSPDRPRWEKEERAVYLRAVKAIGKTTFLVNALDEGIEEPSFGGAMVVAHSGELLAESPHGSDDILLFDVCR